LRITSSSFSLCARAAGAKQIKSKSLLPDGKRPLIERLDLGCGAQLLDPYLIASGRRILLLWPHRQPVGAIRFGYKRRQLLSLAPAFPVELGDLLAARS